MDGYVSFSTLLSVHVYFSISVPDHGSALSKVMQSYDRDPHSYLRLK